MLYVNVVKIWLLCPAELT